MVVASKMGRPIIGKPKTIDVKVRLDEDMHKKLLEYSEKHKITKSETIRRALEDSFEDKQYEQVEKKVMYQKDGKGSGTFKIPIPKKWIEKMELTESDRNLKMSYDESSKKIIIKKIK